MFFSLKWCSGMHFPIWLGASSIPTRFASITWLKARNCSLDSPLLSNLSHCSLTIYLLNTCNSSKWIAFWIDWRGRCHRCRPLSHYRGMITLMAWISNKSCHHKQLCPGQPISLPAFLIDANILKLTARTFVIKHADPTTEKISVQIRNKPETPCSL